MSEIISSDETKFYTYEDAKAALNNMDILKYSIRDLIFIILFAQNKPIRGRILLVKEIFLLYNRILIDVSENPKFVPYKYGPYSFHLTDIIRNLTNDGFISINGKINSKTESFLLTHKGKLIAKVIFSSLPSKTQDLIRKRRKGWDQLGIDGILKYVYFNYKDYKTKSVLKNRYKDIVWGEGRG